MTPSCATHANPGRKVVPPRPLAVVSPGQIAEPVDGRVPHSCVHLHHDEDIGLGLLGPGADLRPERGQDSAFQRARGVDEHREGAEPFGVRRGQVETAIDEAPVGDALDAAGR